jgi:hypothetical protein
MIEGPYFTVELTQRGLEIQTTNYEVADLIEDALSDAECHYSWRQNGDGDPGCLMCFDSSTNSYRVVQILQAISSVELEKAGQAS